MSETISLTIEGQIAYITLCDPRGLNLENLEMAKLLAEKQEEISKNNQLRAVVLRSSVANFSAGADLAFLKAVNPEFLKANLSFLQRTFSRFQELHIPVICAINGLCYGGGLELALSCDIRVAADNAKFAMPEVKFGFTADQTGTTRLTKLVGIGQAKKIILLCDEFDAAEAYRIGLIEYLVKPEELDAQAARLAKRIASLPLQVSDSANWGSMWQQKEIHTRGLCSNRLNRYTASVQKIKRKLLMPSLRKEKQFLRINKNRFINSW